MDDNLRAIEEKVRAGERLTRSDGLALFRCEDLLAVGALADAVRRRRNGDRVYFVRNQHINYSNVCRALCRFCAYGVGPDDPRGYTLSHEEILARARAGVRQGARELHIVGSLHPTLPFDWYVELIERLRLTFPWVHLKAFTAVELDEMARRSGLPVRTVIGRLKAAGVNSLPGGGAEILADRLRADLCPNKTTADRWLAVMREAHELGVPSVATMLYGHVETIEQRVDHLLALRALQDETGGFLCFVPLAFQPAQTALADLPPVAAAESLRTIAAARLLLDNFAHIKAYWVMLGVKLAQTALAFGADDLHGTVVEERIAHDAGASSPPALSVGDLVRLAKEAGRLAVEHDSHYRELRSYGGRAARARGNGAVEAILQDVECGRRLTDDGALRLFESGDLLALGRAADGVRAQLHPEPCVTYVVDRNINYTNICVSGCRFCAFYRYADAPDAYVLDEAALAAKLRETRALGGTQILLQGGLHPTLPLEWYEALVRRIHEEFGLHVHGFSPPEIVHLARLADLPVATVIARLHAAGLDSIPGGGAEILADRVRAEIGPGKCTADEWIEVMHAAHDLGLRTTATMMFGHIETLAERVEHLRRLRDLQDRTGGFTAFIPWTFQPRHTALGGRAVGAFDYLRTLAVARLYLDNIATLQASWVTQGREICQMALFFGANDVGSTMLEENVVRAAGIEFRLTRQDLELMVRQVGREPRQRDCYYRPMNTS